MIRSQATTSTMVNTLASSNDHIDGPEPSPTSSPESTRVGSMIYVGTEGRHDENGIVVERAIDMVIEDEKA